MQIFDKHKTATCQYKKYQQKPPRRYLVGGYFTPEYISMRLQQFKLFFLEFYGHNIYFIINSPIK